MKILICGVEGSGKTRLAKPLANLLGAEYVTKDSHTTELRGYIDGILSTGNKLVVIDKRCSNEQARQYIDADFVIWMDTLTDKSMKRPNKVDYHVCAWFNDTHEILVEVIKKYMERGYHNV